MTRAQANLPALVVALLLVGTSVGAALGLASGAFATADTDPADARLATSLSERLVSPDGPLTRRANVLSRGAIENATVDADWLPGDADVRVRLDAATVVSRGDPTRGVSMRRVVLVASDERRRIEPDFEGGNTVTLPRRTTNATLMLDPPADANITTVRANERVVLNDSEGLDGAYDVTLSRYDTVTLAFEADSSLAPGSVAVDYRAETTTKAVLVVTVDA